MRVAASVLLLLVCGCASPAPAPESGQSPATERAARRAYDGAPPVIPHESFGADCTECHATGGMRVENVGFSPPSPHGEDAGGALRRCVQCHVRRSAEESGLWRENSFVGLPQDLRRGERLNALTPPIMPHSSLLRENCAACHTGETARDEIRTTHPERVQCRQCHVEQTTREVFSGIPL